MPRKRNIMRAFKINEISGVDNPAQAGARATIMKRATPAEIKKHRGDLVSVLTSETEGHQHGIRIWHDEGETGMYISYGYAEGDEHGHDHAIARDATGNFVLGITRGHTHTIDTAAVSTLILNLVTKQGDSPMTDAEKKNLETLQKRLARAEAIGTLNASEREHFDGIDDATAQDTFLAKSVADRKTEIDAAAVAKAAAAAAADGTDPVVYTTMDGLEVRKSEGAVTLSIAKSNDLLRKDNAELRKERETETLRKRAESEIPHLPGTVDERAALLKAVDAMTDESQRKAAHSALKAQNDAFKGIGVSLGTSEGAVDDEPKDKLQKLVDAYSKENKVTEAKAYVKVLATKEGAALYAEDN